MISGSDSVGLTQRVSHVICIVTGMTPDTDACGNTSLPLPGEIKRLLALLLVTDSEEPSGISEHVLSLAISFRDRYSVTLMAGDTSPAKTLLERARSASVHAVMMRMDELRRPDQQACRLSSLLGELAPDIMHLHAGISWEGQALSWTARQCSVPAIIRTEHLPYTLRAQRNPALEAAYAKGVQGVNRIICVSEAARRTFRMSGVPPERYRVVRNGIKRLVSTRTRSATRGMLGLTDRTVILSVGRFTEQKRHIVLLEAVRRLRDLGVAVDLLLAGTGPLENSLRIASDAMRIAGQIHFLGRREDVPDLLAASDIFCLPSFFEGHPLALMEAMAAGVPVVATRSLGITETVMNAETGLLVPIDDPMSLAAALLRIMDDPALATRLAQEARRKALEDFSSERMVAETEAVYREVLEESGPGRRGALEKRAAEG